MDLAILSFAYMAGFLSMLAPCSFAMLPSYIAWYLNKSRGKETTAVALLNGILATMGGGTVMGTIGMLAVLGIRTVNQLVYFRVIIGIVLILMGALMLAGKGLTISLPVTIGDKKGPLGVYIFGALYSLASLGCVASIYIGMVLVVSSQSPAFAATAILTYIFGMGTVLVPLTLAVSKSKTAMLSKLEKVTPHVKIIGGITLVVMGLYLVIFGIAG